MIKNVVFDVGNVLTEFSWREFFVKKGVSRDLLEPLRAATVGTKWWNEIDKNILSQQEILDGFCKDSPELEPVIRKVLSDYKGVITGFDYAIPWVKELKARGAGVYILSNFGEWVREDNREALGFFPYADGGIWSCDVHIIKPDPGIYKALFDKYDLTPSECVFIDDLPSNIDAAKAMGMEGIVFKGYDITKKNLDIMLL